jgi:glycyl-tRNA synthetase beta subunit
MARNNDLVVTAGLNIEASVDQIKNDLDRVSKQLGSDALKISCSIDTKSLSGLQRQLSEISKGLKIDIGSTGVNKIIDEKSIKNQAKALTDALDLAIPRGKTKEIRDVIQGLINDYQKAMQSGNYNEITKSFSALETYVDQFRKDVQDINQEFVEMQQRVKELARSGKTFVSESDYNELKYLLDGGKNANKLLTQAFGLGGWTKDKLKATTSWDSKVQELNEVFDLSRFDSLNDIDSGKFNDHIDGVIQLVNYLNQRFDQGSDFVKEYGVEIDKAFGDQLYTELNRVLGVSTSLDGEFVELFNPDEVQQTTEEVQKLGNEIQRTISKLPDISVGSSTKETLESAKSVLNSYFEASNIDGEANRVKRAIEDTTGELQRFYVQVERGDKSVETLTYAINEQGTAY